MPEECGYFLNTKRFACQEETIDERPFIGKMKDMTVQVALFYGRSKCSGNPVKGTISKINSHGEKGCHLRDGGGEGSPSPSHRQTPLGVLCVLR